MVFSSIKKAFCVMEYARTNSNKIVPLAFTREFSKESLTAYKQRIIAALETVTQDMLQRDWGELEYRLDVCRVTCGAHIEYL